MPKAKNAGVHYFSLFTYPTRDYLMKTLLFAILLAAVVIAAPPPAPKTCPDPASDQVCTPACGTPVNAPMGVPKGVVPGRVVWAHKPEACKWDGETGMWWEDKNVDKELVQKMVDGVITSVADQKTASDAWKKLFTHFNDVHSGQAAGYQAGEKIAIKINLNQQIYHDDCYAGIESNAGSPQLLKALLHSLVNDGQVPQSSISIYDASRCFPDNMYEAPQGIHEDFPDIHIIDNQGGKEGRTKVEVDWDSYLQIDTNETMVAWNLTKLPTVVTNAKYVIELDAFRGHDVAGITESGKNWFGSIYTQDPSIECGPAGHWCPAPVHRFINASVRPMGSFNVLPDLLGHEHLGAKVILFITDGLYGGPTEQLTDPVYFETLSNWWSSSVFASGDPVALDSVLYDFLRNEPNVPCAHQQGWCVDNYLHEAAMAGNPPSGTQYNPTGKKPLESLGVHEHWNNEKDREYVGIDFVKI